MATKKKKVKKATRPTLKTPYKAGFTWKNVRYDPARLGIEELEAIRQEIPEIFN